MTDTHTEQARADEIDRLRDALSGLVDWCKEGCPEGGAFALVEARAALANIWRPDEPRQHPTVKLGDRADV